MATTVAAPARVFGSAIKRREDPRLLTGTAKYTADITLPGQLYAAILRSPHARARIRRRHAQQVVGASEELARPSGECGHRRRGIAGAQRFLDGVLVELVHDAVDAIAVDGLVLVGQSLFGPGVWDLLHADNDVHGRRPTSSASSR